MSLHCFARNSLDVSNIYVTAASIDLLDTDKKIMAAAICTDMYKKWCDIDMEPYYYI